METLQVIPVLRIFDYQKAKEYYIDWLGGTIDWEHTFDDNSPIYMQVTVQGGVFHLTEHYGDCCPGARVFIRCKGLEPFQKLLNEKKYKYYRPGLEKAFWAENTICMDLLDPFGNSIMFCEDLDEKQK